MKPTATILRLVRKGHKVATHPHHHVVIGHGCELCGVLLEALRFELAAHGFLFVGAALLLWTEVRGVPHAE